MHDRRHEDRIQGKAAVTVKIQSAPHAPDLEGRAVLSDVQDLSVDGLQLSVARPVPVGAMLEFKITLDGVDTKFWHIGHVMWHDPASGRVGIQFNNAANPQFSSWRDAVVLMQRSGAPVV